MGRDRMRARVMIRSRANVRVSSKDRLSDGVRNRAIFSVENVFATHHWQGNAGKSGQS